MECGLSCKLVPFLILGLLSAAFSGVAPSVASSTFSGRWVLQDSVGGDLVAVGGELGRRTGSPTAFTEHSSGMIRRGFGTDCSGVVGCRYFSRSRRLLPFPPLTYLKDGLTRRRRNFVTLVRDEVSQEKDPSLQASTANSSGGGSMNKGVLVTVILVPLILGAMMVSTVLAWMCRRTDTLDQTKNESLQRHVAQESSPGVLNVNRALSFGPWLRSLNGTPASRKAGGAAVTSAVELEYSMLQVATNDFSVENLVGEGGFGSVYKAQLDEKHVAAVKKLSNDSSQGDKEFQSEVDLMSKVRHPNLVSLLGFCSNGDSRLLVYEFMSNGSLQDQLHGPNNGALSWHMRIKIALDAARGLEHLHEHCDPPVIHRDFKSSNILLDAQWNAKVSDFGLALSMPVGSKKDTSLQLRGTFGYVAPEYFLTGTLTEKSDVYGFGVILLELLTGRKPVDSTQPTGCQSLVTWATPQLTVRSKLPLILDPVLQDSMNIKHLYQVAAVAALCVQTEPGYRPLIADVVHSLIPLVPVELGGALRTGDSSSDAKSLAAANGHAKPPR